MTENRNHGFRIRFYFGLILIIAACVIGFFNFQKPDAKKIYEEGKALSFSTSNDDKESALKITDISKEPVLKIDEGKTYVYIVEFEKEGTSKGKEPGYIGLEVTKEEGEKLAAKADTMQDNPEYVYGTIIYPYRNKRAIQKYSELITQAFHDYNLLQSNPETTFYFSQTEASSAKKGGLMVAAGLTLAGLIFIGLAFLKRKKVGAAYDEMYAAYPELRGNLDLLRTNATYADDETFVYIYKNHFFTTWSGLEVYDITKANRVYHYQLTHKRYGITTNIESFIIFLSDDRSYKGKKKRIEIKNIGEETDDFLQPFFRAVAQEFPNTAVGYEKNRPF